jgi:ribosomal protein L27
MAEINLLESFGFGNDPIVIRNYIAGVQGGKVLDVTGFDGEFVRAGHVVIRETATDTYKPLGVSDGAYVSLPEGSEYVGVVTATKSVKEPFVGIMYNGEVNDVASPYPITDELKAALKSAIPTLTFMHD